MSDLSSLQDALDKASLHRLIQAVHDIETASFDHYQKASIYVLNNHTIDNFKWFLRGVGYLEQINLSYAQGGYDNIMQDILEPTSPLYRTKPDVIGLSLLLENLIDLTSQFTVAEVTDRIEQIVDTLAARSSSVIVGNTFLSPLYNMEGILSPKMRESATSKIHEINSWYRELSKKHNNLHLIDWNQLEQRLGAPQSRDYRLWYIAKTLLTNKFLKEYALETMKVIKALKGKTKKCLILDCDNTLWGGIIGEDGLDRIQLDPNSYPGNVFYHAQGNVLKLINRGVIICLCSKNNEEDVWNVLGSHPHCLLKRSHLSGWRINWENKASNIRSLAAELNLGTESFVFVDDDPAECALIRQALPETTVLQVPKDLPIYPGVFLEKGLFDALSLTYEDKQRTAMYQAEPLRKNAAAQHQNLDDFLRSLKIVAAIGPMRSHEIPRVAQLTQKTNQFNLTTRRYSESDIAGFANDPNSGVFTLAVKDKFGDMGLTGVLIYKHLENIISIDSLLLSCRILGRKLEQAFVNYCMSELENKWKVDFWKSEYIPSKKNQQVADLWPLFGFAQTACVEGNKVYGMCPGDRIVTDTPFIEIIKPGHIAGGEIASNP